MSIFASLLEMNHSMAQTKMPPYNPYEDTSYEDSITKETHIDAETDGAAWINNAKDRTHSIIANLETSEEPHRLSSFSSTTNPTLPTRPSLHKTPTSTPTSDLPTPSHTCSRCFLPIQPPASPLLHSAKDPCCTCYCPDIKMPQEPMQPAPGQKPHIRRKSSLTMEQNEGVGWHRVHTGGGVECADREDNARMEMSVGAWL